MKFKDYGPNDFDGDEIKEGRGWLPQWWTLMLIAGIVFSVFFVIYYLMILGWNSKEQYAQEIADYQKTHTVVAVKLNDDGSNPLRADAGAIARGQKNFSGLCAACHKADGTGLVGPNLMDDQFLHGNTDAAMYAVIMEGISVEQIKQKPSKGPMPAHKNSFGSQKVLETMAWLADKNSAILPK
ncbi:MAG: c-type cytochrome [Leptospiraceae bacterium]|nr:c-type cytochrome [Leptospiraceae bacterium]MCB1200398.1 c-type cytochrome [Leptospiraceae bacterium]